MLSSQNHQANVHNTHHNTHNTQNQSNNSKIPERNNLNMSTNSISNGNTDNQFQKIDLYYNKNPS